MKDALPYIANAPSVALMKDIILRKEIPQSTVEDWLFTIAFIPRPDENMIEPMAELLKQGYNEPSISLTVSALTRSYCVQNKDCIYNDAVRDILSLLQDRVLSLYKRDKRTRDDVDHVGLSLTKLKSDDISCDLILDDDCVEVPFEYRPDLSGIRRNFARDDREFQVRAKNTCSCC